jgi:gliding motility-associated-like protein
VNYVWNYGDGTTGGGPTGIVTYDSAGTYVVTLIVTDANGCSDKVTGIGQVNPLPVAHATAIPTLTTILNPVIEFTDSSSPPSPAVISNWTWTFGDGNSDSTQNPVHTYTDSGVYVIGLTVMNEFGCEDNDNVTIEIEPEFTFHVPNAFSPNQDDINETFMPTGIGLETDFVMYIYDRWGDLIFESTSVNEPWNGKANNGTDLAQQDVYIWVVEAKDHNQAKHKFVGHVTLIR